MERILYFVCFCIMATISFAFFVWIIAEYDGDMNMTWLTLTLIIFFAVYVMSVVFAVYRFTSTLMKVATAQRSSVTMSSNMDHLQGPQEAIYLDRVQRRYFTLNFVCTPMTLLRSWNRFIFVFAI